VMPNRPGAYEFGELGVETYRRLPAMLSDSLPDRWGNRLIDARLAQEGIPRAAITPLDRLAFTADRGIGALEYRPPAFDPPGEPTAIQLADLVVAARRAVSGRFGGDEAMLVALGQLIEVGASVGGIRPKAVVCFNPSTGQVRSGQFEPLGGYEHWLIKLDGVEETGSLGVEAPGSDGNGRVELAYAAMAKDCGIEMMPCRRWIENERAHFMTRRFDRPASGVKIHVQTLCALDHLDFGMIDTHSYAQYLDVVDRLGLGAEAREQAFRRLAFNVAGVNHDDHPKNLSFCCNEHGDWSLSPAYDLCYAYNPHGRWTQRHQMSVNGKFEGIGRADLLELGDRFAVPSPGKALDQVLDSVSRWAEFAEESGVAGPRIDAVEESLEAFRPT
ncbi:MAG: type II toxin-antitoxin system HipA family toxin, partial [Acidimicrobiales bacterium]